MAQKRWWFIPLTVLFFFSSTAWTGGVRLLYKSHKGEEHSYLLTSFTTSTQEMMGQEMEAKTSSEATVTTKTEEIKPNGDIVMVIWIDSMKVQVHSMRGDTTIVNPGELLKKRSRITISSSGKELSREQIDSVLASPMSAGLTPRLSSIFVPFDPIELSIGDSLVVKRYDTLEVMGGKTVSHTVTRYFVKKPVKILGHECVDLPFTQSTKLEGTGTMMGMPFFVDGEGSATGTTYFDVFQGVLVSVESKASTEMTVASSGEQKMVIPIRQETEYKLKLLK